MRMIGLDSLGAAVSWVTTWDEVRLPDKVAVFPRGVGSTSYTDVARVAIVKGNFWTPEWDTSSHVWDDTSGPLTPAHSGPAPIVTIYFRNGSRKTFNGLESVVTHGGMLARGVSQRSRMTTNVHGDMGSGGAPSAPITPSSPDPTNPLFNPANFASGAPPLPVDGRPAKGWSQPQPDAIGPAITPASLASKWNETDYLAIGVPSLFGAFIGGLLAKASPSLGAFVGAGAGGFAGIGVQYARGRMGAK